MNRRLIDQTRVFVLALNAFGRAEDHRIAAVALDYNALVKKYNEDLLPVEERFRDELGMMHSFRVGSPFFNLNPCASLVLNDLNYYGAGIHDEWIDTDKLRGTLSRYYWVDGYKYNVR